LVSAEVLRDLLVKNRIRVLSWGKDRKTNFLETPAKPGVYALYWGTTLQYVGSTSKSLHLEIVKLQRISQWDSDCFDGMDMEIPFGSFAWFVVPMNQVKKAETLLVNWYDPPYNRIYQSLLD
jgi:hypothetical protein